MINFNNSSTRECLDFIETRNGDINAYSDEESLQMDASKYTFSFHKDNYCQSTELIEAVTINSNDTSTLVTGINLRTYNAWKEKYEEWTRNNHTFSDMKTQKCLDIIISNNGNISNYSDHDINQFVIADREVASSSIIDKIAKAIRTTEYLVTIVSKSNDSLNTRIPYADYMEFKRNKM